ncbi:MAG: entericidin EcnAB [Betaproteobacteria bacterium HGW-Betaproteobacteria-3]|jgi:predicted small secreted protein|nr:MAG: entericidin EcnAB [Betaproteobacteria bacterium HGW-Betaproteobacteria-3]
MKTIALIVAIVASSWAMTGCNTWAGVKEDVKDAGQATGKGIKKAGEKIQDVAK